MADLPQDCVAPDLQPFSHVGIDYFGPLEVKRGRAQVSNIYVPGESSGSPGSGKHIRYTLLHRHTLFFMSEGTYTDYPN